MIHKDKHHRTSQSYTGDYRRVAIGLRTCSHRKAMDLTGAGFELGHFRRDESGAQRS